MKGIITSINELEEQGVIKSEHGELFRFSTHEWKSKGVANEGDPVDFSLDDEDSVENIYSTLYYCNGSSKKIPSVILSATLGFTGAHKFFMGYYREGLVILSIWLTLVFIAPEFSSLLVILGLIEAIIYLFLSDDKFMRKYQINKRAWF